MSLMSCSHSESIVSGTLQFDVREMANSGAPIQIHIQI